MSPIGDNVTVPRRAIWTEPSHTPTRTFPGIVVFRYTGSGEAPLAEKW